MAEPVVPLSAKLGIRDGSSVVILHLPRNLALDLPPGVSVHRRRAHCDVALAFFTRRALSRAVWTRWAR